MRESCILHFAILVGLFYCAACNSQIPYKYSLEERNGAVAGRISIATRQGDRVTAILEQMVSEGEEATIEEEFLEVVIKQLPAKSGQHGSNLQTSKQPTGAVSNGVTAASSATIPHPNATRTNNNQVRTGSVLADDILSGDILSPHHPLHKIHLTHLNGHHMAPKMNKRDIQNHATGDVIEADVVVELKPDTAPVNAPDAKFYIHGTDVFIVDSMNQNYIVIDNVEGIGEHESIEFYVYLVDNNDNVVSNPLPFIVYVDREAPDTGYPAAAAVFAGVLVLCVIVMAILIPLVTRAKRRKRQGKPLFKLGSHPSSVDLESAGRLPRKPSEPNWYGNNTFIDPEEEVAQEQREFSREIRHVFRHPSHLQAKKEPVSERSSSGIDAGNQSVDATDGASGDDDNISARL